MGQIKFILGGARSGKSSYAQRLAMQLGGRVVYIATARALDEEMKARIVAHQHERPAQWQTLELSLGLGQVLQGRRLEADLVLLDCLTMLVTNVMLDATSDENQPDEAAATTAVEAELSALLLAIRSSQARWIIVSNEVGLGLVPPYPLGRLYRDLLGRANQRLAAVADEVFWMVAGIPVPIHSFRV